MEEADIVALGDSYAHGACIPSDQGFVSLIRSEYPATVNLGVNGDGPLAILATLKECAFQMELLERLERNGAPAEKENLDLFRAMYRLTDFASKERSNVLQIVSGLGIDIVDMIRLSADTRTSRPFSRRDAMPITVRRGIGL
jgi:hypothetical protein